ELEDRVCNAGSVSSTAREASSWQVCLRLSAAALPYPPLRRHTADGCRLWNKMSSRKQDIQRESAHRIWALYDSSSAPVAEFGARVQRGRTPRMPGSIHCPLPASTRQHRRHKTSAASYGRRLPLHPPPVLRLATNEAAALPVDPACALRRAT